MNQFIYRCMRTRSANLPKLCCLVIGLLLFTAAFSQNNYSGLLNKDLTPDINGGQLIGSVLDRLLYGAGFSGSVTTVKVLDDADISLTVRVNYTGYTEGFILVSLTDGSMNALAGFQPQKIPVDRNNTGVEVKFQLDWNAFPKDKPFTVPRLVVLVSKDEKGSHGIRTSFKLDKKFNNPLTGENIIIPAALIPIGSAASLPATLPASGGSPQLILPQRNVYEVIKNKQMYLLKVDTQVAKPKPIAAQPAVLRTTGASQPMIRMTAGRKLVNPDMKAVSVLHIPVQPASPAPAPNKDPQGPQDQPLSFWGDFIYSDVDFESQDKITSVSLNIYPDKNRSSGIFYYLPIAYDIKYDASKGYNFNMDYGTASADGSDSKVRMSGTLASGISLYEVQFIKNLMDAYNVQNPGLNLQKPLPLPISEPPVITLGDELKSFGITDVHINNASSITDPVEFSWTTDGTTAAELENLLKANSGIVGKMQIKPQGASLGIQEIPVRIRLIDEHTFGRFNMTPSDFRSRNWRNETPFPLRLQYLHCMIIDKNKDGKEGPIIYSWNLGDMTIPSRCQVKFNTAVIPQWLDNYKGKQARLWLDYNLVDTCSPCNEAVFKTILSSVTRPQLSDVVFRIIPFFEDQKISYMDIEMRSLQGDPAGKSQVSFTPVHITRDSTDYTAGKIYLPPGSDPAFDYRITIVTKEGAEMRSDWIARNSLSVPFGSFQLKELFPSFK
jgi:hypothetical protein